MKTSKKQKEPFKKGDFRNRKMKRNELGEGTEF